MPRNLFLKNIANGLGGSFISRNNDLDGYWAIGKLRSLAEQHELSAVSLDLLAQSMQPPSHEFDFMLARYRHLLARLAGLSGIRFEDITAARITVDFAPAPWHRASYYQARWGDQFILTVTIGANGMADGIVFQPGYCRPHDPASERRSVRPAYA